MVNHSSYNIPQQIKPIKVNYSFISNVRPDKLNIYEALYFELIMYGLVSNATKQNTYIV